MVSRVRTVWWDGRRCPEGRVPWEGGLRLGDGVFETLRTFGGAPFLLRAHLDRLRRGALAIGLREVPRTSELETVLRRSLASASPRTGGRRPRRPRELVVRIALVEGGRRTHLLFMIEPLPRTPDHPMAPRGVQVGTSRYPHPGTALVPPGSPGPVKWLGRGPQSHALRDARAHGWEEGLLCDGRGNYVEGTRSNLLAMVGNRLLAPGPRSGALSGITRELAVRGAAARGFKVVDRPVSPREIRRASEVLLTSSLLGVVAVRSLDGRPVGRRDASSGPLERALRDHFASRILQEEEAWRKARSRRSKRVRPDA